MRNRRSKREKKHTKLHVTNFPRFFVSIIIIITLLFFILLGGKFIFNKISNNLTSPNTNNDYSSLENNNSSDNNSPEESTKKMENITANIAFTGDIMSHNTMIKDAYDSTSGTYDYSHYFTNIKYYLQTPDLTVGNLETTFAGNSVGYSGYPTFNTPEILAKNLKKVGFDVVSTANNHCMDKKYSGLESTIKYLDEADLSHTGTYISEESQNTILIKNVKGIKIAFVSFTYGTNGIPVPTDKKYAVNFLDDETILKQVNLAKEQNPDLICALVHWGNEYQTTPNSSQKQIANLLIDNGVNLIIGNHPHVPQPLVLTKNSNNKDVFIAYSLGNFMADQNKAYTRDSLILNLTITKNGETNDITIDKYDYTPIYTYKNTSQKTKAFSILDIKSVIESYDAGYDTSIGQNMYTKLKTELQNIKDIVGKEVK